MELKEVLQILLIQCMIITHKNKKHLYASIIKIKSWILNYELSVQWYGRRKMWARQLSTPPTAKNGGLSLKQRFGVVGIQMFPKIAK
jgi:hypothetical protein